MRLLRGRRKDCNRKEEVARFASPSRSLRSVTRLGRTREDDTSREGNASGATAEATSSVSLDSMLAAI
jgi:hypothetical protein